MASTPPTKPTIVVVHGSFHRPEHFKYVTNHLKKAGYEVVADKLPSFGVLPAPLENGLEADAIAVRDSLQQLLDQGKDVVLVMHSYSGAPGSEAVSMLKKGSKGTILRLVYIAAWVFNIGDTLLGRTAPGGRDVADEKDMKLVDGHLLYHLSPVKWMYQDISKERADESVALLGPSQISSLNSPAKHAAWKEEGIPVTYIACKQDATIRFAFQEDMIEQIKAGNSDVEAVIWDCGHSPHLNEKYEEKISDIIRKAAGEKL